MREMNYSVIYFSNVKIHELSPRHGGPDPWAQSTGTWCTKAQRLLVYGFAVEILWIKGVRDNLISTAHSWMNGQYGVLALGGDRLDAHGGAKGGSPKLSLALTPVAHPPLGIHLRYLQKMGVPTEVFAGISEVRRGLAMMKWAQRESVRSQGPCSDLWLWFLSWRWWWCLLFLSNQPDGVEARWNSAAMTAVFSGRGKRVIGSSEVIL
jgi:hypothetical protein